MERPSEDSKRPDGEQSDDSAPAEGVNGKAPDRKFSDDNEPPEKPDDALVQGAGDAEKT